MAHWFRGCSWLGSAQKTFRREHQTGGQRRSVGPAVQRDAVEGDACLLRCEREERRQSSSFGRTRPAHLLHAPSDLSASVNGSTVTLAWNAPSSGGAPMGYQISAGCVLILSNSSVHGTLC